MAADTAAGFGAAARDGAAGPPPLCPACAVHTEVTAATAVTPTAAATTRPYHPRPPCRAMSFRPLPSAVRAVPMPCAPGRTERNEHGIRLLRITDNSAALPRQSPAARGPEIAGRPVRPVDAPPYLRFQ
ncbi:hypothetical protein EASAB2608_00575 [Streptomyces sp. EAS-AB2608]|nr:hypothetical protein EASAB2608_00575 [Streptomyces sp. EAS-AB2608]